ncbi:MAG: TonB-dependent receptor [Acidobacteriota bacterium]|nr:TonB-dependent receptor [Acidobacteriota bacterium]
MTKPSAFAIVGQVVDQNGGTIDSATVKLVGLDNDLRAETKTQTDGSFRFENIPSGRYQLTVRIQNFAETSKEIDLNGSNLNLPDTVLHPNALSAEVTVTATRTIESIAAIPASVTVIEQEQIQNQADLSNNLGDALGKLVPGLALGSQSNSSYGQTLRGRNAQVLIDGVPQSTTRNITRDLTTIDPSAIERIEVIRGTTAIYGEGATGGIISITTKRPTEGKLSFTTDFGGSLSLSHPSDSFGGFIRQTVTGKRGAFDFLVNGSFDRTSGFFDAEGDRIPPDPHGQGGLADTNIFNVLGKFGFDLTRRQRLQFTVNRYYAVQDTDYASDPTVNNLPALSVKARTISGLQLDENQDSGNTLFNADYSNSNLFGSRLQTQIYRRQYISRFFPFDGRAFPVFGRTIYQSRLEQKKTGGRLAVETPLPRWSGLTAVYGVDYVNEHTSQPVGIMDATAFDQSGGLVFRKIRDSIFVPLIKQQNTGVFGQFEWRKFEKLVLRGGVRHERINVNIDDFTTIANNFIRGGELNYADTLFNFGGVFYANSVFSVFANFGQGFSVPDIGLVLRGSPAGATVNTLPFAAQKVDTYETGVRASWQRVQTSLSLFYNTSDLGASSGGFNQPVIRAPEKVYGLEAIIDAQPNDRFRIGSSLTWLEGESDPNLDGIYTYLNSYRIPPAKVTAYAEHNTLSNWYNRLQLTYSGERKRFETNTGFGLRPVDDYTTLDYLSTVRLPKGTLKFGVENLLNKQYFTRESQLLRTGFNSSYAAAQGAVISFGYSITY